MNKLFQTVLKNFKIILLTTTKLKLGYFKTKAPVFIVGDFNVDNPNQSGLLDSQSLVVSSRKY